MRFLRTSVAIALFAMPACVLKLDEKNDPLPAGNVSGVPADCNVVTPPGVGGPSGNADTKLVGRFDVSDPNKPSFDWSGNEINARFSGTEVTIGLDVGAPILFVAVIDDRPPIKFEAIPSQKGYQVAKDLPAGEHEITVHRNSEALYGGTTFTGFNFGAGKQLPPNRRERRIEIIGDSITCGYGNDGPNATCPKDVDDEFVPGARVPLTQNQYLAYGSVAGRALFADVTTVCYSGKGIYQNYRDTVEGEGTGVNDPTVVDNPDPDIKTLMPEFYKRTLAGDPASVWDFSKEPEPQVVVINMGTNDFTRDVNGDSIADGVDENVFHDRYTDFVNFVRSKRPNAHIFIAVPPMLDDKFPFDNARKDFIRILYQMATEFDGRGDHKVYAFELVQQGQRYGLGCDYHPNLTVHAIMGQQMTDAIKSKTCW